MPELNRVTNLKSGKPRALVSNKKKYALRYGKVRYPFRPNSLSLIQNNIGGNIGLNFVTCGQTLMVLTCVLLSSDNLNAEWHR